MDLLKIAGAALAGTTAMTMFSYGVSDTQNKQFREPEILAKLIRRLFHAQDKTTARAEGWALHYVVGTGFAFAYDQLFKHRKLNPDFPTGIMLGATSGLIGIFAWNMALKIHPNPPKLELKRYLGHLLIAHILYGAVAAGTYRRIGGIRETKSSNTVLPEETVHGLS